MRFINEINRLGYWVILINGATNRSYEEQAELKRLNDKNAKAGHSRHERGAAIDITIKNKTTGVIHSKTTSKEGWVATGVIALAKSMGLQWAGGDGSFGSYIDRVHFQIIGNGEKSVTYEDRVEEYTEEKIVKEINRDKVFSNFKVNKFSFNFFLKGMQFNSSLRKVTSRNVYQNDAQGTPLPVVVKAKRKK